MDIYQSRPNLMIGFHGCDVEVRDKLVTKPDTIKISREDFDWLGHGFYIWENNYSRAMQWAEDKMMRSKAKSAFTPSVLGVIYQLEYCLDFTDTHFISLLPEYYKLFKSEIQSTGNPLPTNKDSKTDLHKEKILRELDCALIEYMHNSIRIQVGENIQKTGYSELKEFDTVRGIFTEGGPVFEGAGIQAKNHIQICIRNMNCIKGFFIPRRAV